MSGNGRACVAIAAGAALTFAACGDDGNDGALMARRAADRAAEIRTATTVGEPPPATRPVTGTDPTTASTSVPTLVATTAAAIEPTGVVVPVVALDNSFRPDLIEIAVGDEVLWENRGLNDHDVLYVAGDDWGVEVADFGPGAAYAHVFTEPGEYRYYCSIHGNETVGMVGTIVVTG